MSIKEFNFNRVLRIRASITFDKERNFFYFGNFEVKKSLMIIFETQFFVLYANPKFVETAQQNSYFFISLKNF